MGGIVDSSSGACWVAGRERGGGAVDGGGVCRALYGGDWWIHAAVACIAILHYVWRGLGISRDVVFG